MEGPGSAESRPADGGIEVAAGEGRPAPGGLVTSVEAGSPGAEIGLTPGDRVVEVNGKPLRDFIDYLYEVGEEHIKLRVVKPDGQEWFAEIEREPGRGLGIEFADPLFDGLLRCRNNCLFCFLKQLPRGLRRSLYVRDDDYRLSFLHGNFITLSNLDPGELGRIIRLRLSPLYISVHATDPVTRRKLMGYQPAGRIMEQLRRLVEAGITVHAQVVLCPGYNDREVLDRTIEDLAELWPGVASLGVVPVGLTRHREGLPFIAPVGPELARAVVDQVEGWQVELAKRGLKGFVFLADEFYVLAGRKVPAAARYGDFPQVQNGIGLIRLFLDDFRRSKRHWPRTVAARTVTAVTGTSARSVIEAAAAELASAVAGLEVDVLPVVNDFFGPSVTVAGLLTGRDIGRALAEVGRGRLGDEVLVPGAAVRPEDGRFLDDLTPEDLSAEVGVPVRVVSANGEAFAAAAIGEGDWGG